MRYFLAHIHPNQRDMRYFIAYYFFVSLMSSELNFQTLIYFQGRPKDRRRGF